MARARGAYPGSAAAVKQARPADIQLYKGFIYSRGTPPRPRIRLCAVVARKMRRFGPMELCNDPLPG